jgi:hypothetical protein
MTLPALFGLLLARFESALALLLGYEPEKLNHSKYHIFNPNNHGPFSPHHLTASESQ